MALRSNPSNLVPFSGGTVANNTNFPNGINVYSEFIANNTAAPIKYYKLARVRFTTIYNRALFNIKLYHTGSNLKIANIKGYFNNDAIKRNIHNSSFLMVINNSGSTGFSAGDLSYVPLDSGSDTDDYIVDVYLKVGGFAKLYENTESAAFENGASLTIKPDGSTLIDTLPVAGTTTSIGGVTYTYGTFVDGIITSDLNSQTATIDNAIPKFSGTAGQLVGSQKLSINASDQLVSTVATGAGSPFVVSSTTRVDNLNASLLNGLGDSGYVKTVSNSSLNNNISIQAKETGGTARNLLSLNASNAVQVGATTNATTINSTPTGLMHNNGTTTLNIVTEVTGTAPPAVTPNFVGQMFVDTTNKKIYVATGTTNSSDWTILN